ncbi:hypothetical protein [Motilibacter deserti]|uniref:Excreted virulence factor EspC (Type VII ESX diderm) n=1 Tax=Motilibacter deserti TaxID=2714956 RepID=A0ABX0GV63_9ACTN|nr:hypothetical protein [Motilibacter deserti]NHC14816.1 hypothetical protein [Motilibacter deserti]
MLSDAGGAVNRVVELTLEEVRSIANGLATPTDEVQGQGAQFSGTPVDAGMFGRSAAGEALAGTHRTAHQIFRETVEQVIADLEAFREQLTSTVATYEARDADVSDALSAFRWRERSHSVAIDADRAHDLAGAEDVPPPPAPAAQPAPAVPSTQPGREFE